MKSADDVVGDVVARERERRAQRSAPATPRRQPRAPPRIPRIRAHREARLGRAAGGRPHGGSRRAPHVEQLPCPARVPTTSSSDIARSSPSALAPPARSASATSATYAGAHDITAIAASISSSAITTRLPSAPSKRRSARSRGPRPCPRATTRQDAAPHLHRLVGHHADDGDTGKASRASPRWWRP